MKTQPLSVSDRLDAAVQKELEDIKRHPCSPDWRLCSRNHDWIVAETMALIGDHASAAEAATEMVASCDKQWQESYDAACILARCVSLAQSNDQIPERERQRLAKTYTSRAVRFLRSAIHHGFHELGVLAKDPDLDPLRSSAKFKRLLSTAKRTIAGG